MKIYKERAQMKPAFDRNVFKENFKIAYGTDEDVVQFRKKMTSVEKEEKGIKAEIDKKKKDEKDKDK